MNLLVTTILIALLGWAPLAQALNACCFEFDAHVDKGSVAMSVDHDHDHDRLHSHEVVSNDHQSSSASAQTESNLVAMHADGRLCTNMADCSVGSAVFIPSSFQLPRFALALAEPVPVEAGVLDGAMTGIFHPPSMS